MFAFCQILVRRVRLRHELFVSKSDQRFRMSLHDGVVFVVRELRSILNAVRLIAIEGRGTLLAATTGKLPRERKVET